MDIRLRWGEILGYNNVLVTPSLHISKRVESFISYQDIQTAVCMMQILIKEGVGVKGSPEWIERYADIDVVPSYADYDSNNRQDLEINIVRYVREDIHENLNRKMRNLELRVAELQESNLELMKKLTGGRL